MGKFLKIRQKIGKIICLLAIAGSIYGIFVIAAGKSTSENIGWGVDFSVAMFQDLILTPLLFIGSQYIVYRLSNSSAIKSARIKSYLSSKLLDSNVALIYSKWLGKMSKEPKIAKIQRINFSLDTSTSPTIMEQNTFDAQNHTPSKMDLLENISIHQSFTQDSNPSIEIKPEPINPPPLKKIRRPMGKDKLRAFAC